MDLKFKTKKFVEKHELINPGDHVLIAVSGGVDSMLMFYLLDQLKDEIGFIISVVHINHGLRGSDSEGDELFVSNICEKRGVPFFSVRWSGVEKGDNLQEAARNFRYDSFAEIAEKIEANRVALAHNLNDQAETVLLNLIRGAGLDGICGMSLKKNLREGLSIIRPLLEVSRVEIEEVAEKEGVEFRKDLSNDQTKYTRNFIRHKVMPLIQEINPNATRSIANMTKLLQVDESYIQTVVTECLDEIKISEKGAEIVLDNFRFKELDPAIRTRILKLAYSKISGSVAGITRDHLLKMDEIATGDKKDGEYNLPNSLKFRRKNGSISIDKI